MMGDPFLTFLENYLGLPQDSKLLGKYVHVLGNLGVHSEEELREAVKDPGYGMAPLLDERDLTEQGLKLLHARKIMRLGQQVTATATVATPSRLEVIPYAYANPQDIVSVPRSHTPTAASATSASTSSGRSPDQILYGGYVVHGHVAGTGGRRASKGGPLWEVSRDCGGDSIVRYVMKPVTLQQDLEHELRVYRYLMTRHSKACLKLVDLIASEGSNPSCLVLEKANSTLAYELEHDLSIDRALVAQRLVEALDDLHSHGIMHGDIKPSNIVVVRGGGSFELKFIDYDSARWCAGSKGESPYPPDVECHLTSSAQYVAPEVALGRNELKPSLDIDMFSVGLVLAELFAKPSRPVRDHECDVRAEAYAGEEAFFRRYAKMVANPKRPWLADLLKRLCSWDREERISASQLKLELYRALGVAYSHEMLVKERNYHFGHGEVLPDYRDVYNTYTKNEMATMQHVLTIPREDVRRLLFKLSDEMLRGTAARAQAKGACEAFMKKMDDGSAYYRVYIDEQPDQMKESDRVENVDEVFSQRDEVFSQSSEKFLEVPAHMHRTPSMLSLGPSESNTNLSMDHQHQQPPPPPQPQQQQQPQPQQPPQHQPLQQQQQQHVKQPASSPSPQTRTNKQPSTPMKEPANHSELVAALQRITSNDSVASGSPLLTAVTHLGGGQLDAAEAVVAILKEYIINEEVTEAALEAMCRMMEGLDLGPGPAAEARARFGYLGACEQVMVMARSKPALTSGIQHVLQAVGWLAYEDSDNAARLRTAGAYNLIVGALCNFSSEKRVQAWGCFSLGSLASSDDVEQARQGSAGACTLILKALERFPHDHLVQAHACRAVGALVNLGQILEVSRKGGKLVVKALENFPHDRLVQAWGCVALALIAEDADNGSTLGSSGACDVVVKAMENFPMDPLVQAYGCLAVRALAETIDAPTLPNRAGKLVLKAMGNFLNDRLVQAWGALSLAFIAEAAARVKDGPRLELHKAFKYVLRALHSFPSDQLVQALGCLAVANLLVHARLLPPGTCGKYYGTARTLVLNALREFPYDHAVQLNACLAVTFVAMWDETEPWLEACDLVVAALRAFDSDYTMQDRACLAIATLAKKNPKNRKRLQELGARSVAKEGLFNFPNLKHAKDAIDHVGSRFMCGIGGLW